jgi:hypothetical protein
MASDQYDLVIALNEVAVRLGWRPWQADTSTTEASVTYLTEKEHTKRMRRRAHGSAEE